MKQLPLRTTKYRLLEKGFKDWLSTLGYSKHTVYGLPYQAREFLHWLEQQGITGVTTITGSNAKDFMEYFRNRKNQRRSGGLSNAHINGQVDCLNKFFDYLNATGHTDVRVNLTRV
ncbi:MAG: hypothetical protein KJ607_10805, partial [Bacteroidetes bacterium]|nr:hypothetical protein [Bacteroidota bacterium]